MFTSVFLTIFLQSSAAFCLKPWKRRLSLLLWHSWFISLSFNDLFSNSNLCRDVARLSCWFSRLFIHTLLIPVSAYAAVAVSLEKLKASLMQFPTAEIRTLIELYITRAHSGVSAGNASGSGDLIRVYLCWKWWILNQFNLLLVNCFSHLFKQFDNAHRVL